MANTSSSSSQVHVNDRPMAAEGLFSYRCKSTFGWIMIGAHNQADAFVQAKRSSPTARESNLQFWNGTAYEHCTVEDPHLLKAQVYGIKSPGGTHKELYDVTLDVTDPTATTMFKRVGAPNAVQYWQLDIQGVTVSFGPDVEDLCSKVDKAIQCQIPAQFRPQEWVGDNAFTLESKVSSFNAMPALIEMSLTEVAKMFDAGCDFDLLSEGLPAREAHDGPFEVDVEESDVIEMVQILAGIHATTDNPESISELSQKAWNSFCKAAKSILAEKAETIMYVEDLKQSSGLASQSRPHEEEISVPGMTG